MYIFIYTRACNKTRFSIYTKARVIPLPRSNNVLDEKSVLCWINQENANIPPFHRRGRYETAGYNTFIATSVRLRRLKETIFNVL